MLLRLYYLFTSAHSLNFVVSLSLVKANSVSFAELFLAKSGLFFEEQVRIVIFFLVIIRLVQRIAEIQRKYAEMIIIKRG